jgi:hypothetical protein
LSLRLLHRLLLPLPVHFALVTEPGPEDGCDDLGNRDSDFFCRFRVFVQRIGNVRNDRSRGFDLDRFRLLECSP